MTRVVAGTFGGRRLQVPPGQVTRPTADRAREGLFSSLQSLLDLPGATVLDLYAGSGALGIEALSRGAAQATFVEEHPLAVEAIRANLVALDLTRAEVQAEPVTRWLETVPARCYDLVLADPPYACAIEPVLALLVAWVAPGGVVVLERATRGPAPRWPPQLSALRSRRYGEATLWYGSRS